MAATRSSQRANNIELWSFRCQPELGKTNSVPGGLRRDGVHVATGRKALPSSTVDCALSFQDLQAADLGNIDNIFYPVDDPIVKFTDLWYEIVKKNTPIPTPIPCILKDNIR